MHVDLHGQGIPVRRTAGEPGALHIPAARTVVSKDEEPQRHGCDSVEAAEDDLQEEPRLRHCHGPKAPESDVQEMGDHQSPELHPQGVYPINIHRMGAGVQRYRDGPRIGQECAATTQPWWRLQWLGCLFGVPGLTL